MEMYNMEMYMKQCFILAIGVIGLALALPPGQAVALEGVTSAPLTEARIKTLIRREIRRLAPSLTVGKAGKAVTADTAGKANRALTADTAGTATRATTATTADSATKALRADVANSANTSLLSARSQGPAVFAKLGPTGTLFPGETEGVTQADVVIPLDASGNQIQGLYCFLTPTGVIGGNVVADASFNRNSGTPEFGLGRDSADNCPVGTQYHVLFGSQNGFFLQLYQ